MNIFVLDASPEDAAQQMCDKHVVKMILESAQLLSTAIRELLGDAVADERQCYKKTHVNHPCSKWTRETWGNYNWLHRHSVALCDEYTRRYGKVHKCESLISRIWKPGGIALRCDRTPFAQCMPDQYKVDGDAVSAYRKYYKGEKAYFAKWKLGEPEWWNV